MARADKAGVVRHTMLVQALTVLQVAVGVTGHLSLAPGRFQGSGHPQSTQRVAATCTPAFKLAGHAYNFTELQVQENERWKRKEKIGKVCLEDTNREALGRQMKREKVKRK